MLQQDRIKLQQEICFFGRRCGKTLSPTQQNLLDNLLPQLLIDSQNLDNIFAETELKKNMHLEIGFGGGEYLLHHASLRPDTNFIGIEPFVSGMVKMLTNLTAKPELMQNIRLYNDDAAKLLKALPSNSLTGLDLFYPDPWQKKKHNKRRFVNAENLNQIVRIVKTGGLFRFASDIPDYINWTLLHCEANGNLKWQAKQASDWQNPYDNWLSTRYEQKAIREKRIPAYLSFIIEKTKS